MLHDRTITTQAGASAYSHSLGHERIRIRIGCPEELDVLMTYGNYCPRTSFKGTLINYTSRKIRFFSQLYDTSNMCIHHQCHLSLHRHAPTSFAYALPESYRDTVNPSATSVRKSQWALPPLHSFPSWMAARPRTPTKRTRPAGNCTILHRRGAVLPALGHSCQA